MEENLLTFEVEIKSQVAKYADGVSQDDIESGIAVPYEVVEEGQKVQMSREQLERLGFDVDALNLKGSG